ncbi:MBL fold metallo-hydrolase [Halalkalibacterium halodurans]|nr:MBL fold metallo-hydrolase [Halalkalibacterium halodurans]MED4174862.1 MBL fold metallo-hydrolase [Halalkalibacterium halodurans]
MLYMIASIIVLCLIILSYLNLHPVFGENPSKEQKKMYEGFDNYVDGTFVNLVPTTMDMGGISGGLSLLRDAISGGQDRNPDDHLPVTDINWPIINSEEDSLTWFGHSAFLLSIDQKKILVDPMLGPVASPVPFAGSKRYSEDMLHIIDEMPPIDAVFITHDHYDHLDYPSILRLKNKVEHFFVPYGVGAHLIRWGVEEEKISELNWWDETKFKGLTIAFTPSKHFSGRGLFNRNSTLWGGWVILGNQTRFYTSGDGGYDSHFEEIGEKYGPFHITLMEGGQYDHRWDWVHMTPEEAVQAHLDVNGENMMLIHWGAFTLAYHGWTEPIERALEAAEKEDVNMLAPSIGETVILDGQYTKPESLWWEM